MDKYEKDLYKAKTFKIGAMTMTQFKDACLNAKAIAAGTDHGGPRDFAHLRDEAYQAIV